MKTKKRKNFIKVLLPRILIAWVLSGIVSFLAIDMVHNKCVETFMNENSRIVETYYKYATRAENDEQFRDTPTYQMIFGALAEGPYYGSYLFDSLPYVNDVRFAYIYDADNDSVFMDSGQRMYLNMKLVTDTGEPEFNPLPYYSCEVDLVKGTEPFQSILKERENRTATIKDVYGNTPYNWYDIAVEEVWFDPQTRTFLPIRGTVRKTTYANIYDSYKSDGELVNKKKSEEIPFDISAEFQAFKEDYSIWTCDGGLKPTLILAGTTNAEYEYINGFLKEHPGFDTWEYTTSTAGGGAFRDQPMVYAAVQELPDSFGNKEIHYICVKNSVLGSYYPIWILIAAAVFAVLSGIAVLSSVFAYQKLLYFYRNEDYRIALMNSLAHDLKTPLTVMSGFAENLKANIQTEKKEEYADGILQNTAYMNNIITDVLMLSKAENEGKTIRKKTDLVELFKASGEEFAEQIKSKNLTVMYEKSYVRKADAVMMRRACDNLLGNAVKYTKEGGTIRIYPVDKPFYHVFVIENFPIDPVKGESKKLWEAFVKDDESRSDVSGNGLGLAIVRSILVKNKMKAKIVTKNDLFRIIMK